MKNILFLFCLFTISFSSAQIVNIPDANFKAKLLEADATNTIAKDLTDNYFKIDANNDGEIQESEALQVSYLKMEDLIITNMDGISSFINLEYLYAVNVGLTAIDIGNNINLKYLNLSVNDLSILDLSTNISLESLLIGFNDIATIDLSNNINLIDLSVDDNFLTALDVSNNINLIDLSARNCTLTTFNVDNNVNLESLNMQINQLTTIDVSNNINLTYLNLSSNTLNTIDVSANLSLESLFLINNQLGTIDISNNINLIDLSIRNTNMATLNIDTNINLESLIVSSNQLTSIDISNNVNLIDLSIDQNNLTALNVDTNINLENLDAYNNQLISIGVSNNINLIDLSINGNNLTILNVDNNINLESLRTNNNQLTSINVSNNLSLESLLIDNNQIFDLDVSNNSNLSTLSYGNNPNLVSVNQKNGSTLIYNFVNATFYGGNCPSLQYVCANDSELSDLNLHFFIEGMNVNVNTYCSFPPGGDYNTITGNITFDSQNDGCDIIDDRFPFVKINIDDGSSTDATYTNYNGIYNFYTQDGTFTIRPDIENPTFFNTTPIDATINFPDTNNNIEIQDFCITANGVHNDLEIVIASTIPARPGFDAEYLITYKNKGNQTLSGDFSFAYDDSILDYVSATEVLTSQNTGLLTWDYIDLLPFEGRSVYVTLNVNSPMETPAVNIGDELNFTAIINPITGDELPNDNTFAYKQTVIGSYDPNDITCVEGDFVEPTAIGEYLHYIINFENTGNADAQNIVVKTEIDETMFDVSSLRLLSSSHNADVRVKGNIIEIIFESIYLASGGHGNILLKVQTQDVLVEDDTVTKNAEIFFDYNFPIETNNANTTFALLSNPEFETDASISLYPNPVKDIMTISARNTIKNISLFDVQGRVLLSKTNASKEVKIDLSTRADGVYFIKITTDKGTNVEKIIKN